MSFSVSRLYRQSKMQRPDIMRAVNACDTARRGRSEDELRVMITCPLRARSGANGHELHRTDLDVIMALTATLDEHGMI